MCIQLDRVAGNYEVSKVELEHNHLLQLPQTRHLSRPKKSSTNQAAEGVGFWTSWKYVEAFS
jgi:zinc finger SWIM domain-containing protein 3